MVGSNPFLMTATEGLADKGAFPAPLFGQASGGGDAASVFAMLLDQLSTPVDGTQDPLMMGQTTQNTIGQDAGAAIADPAWPSFYQGAPLLLPDSQEVVVTTSKPVLGPVLMSSLLKNLASNQRDVQETSDDLMDLTGTPVEKKKEMSIKDAEAAATALAFVPVALPMLVPVQDQVKALILESSEGVRVQLSRSAIIQVESLVTETLEVGGAETAAPMDQDHALTQGPNVDVHSKRSDMASSQMSSSIPLNNNDLDVALEAMAEAKAPIQVAAHDDMLPNDKALSAAMQQASLTKDGVEKSSQTAAPVVAQVAAAPVAERLSLKTNTKTVSEKLGDSIKDVAAAEKTAPQDPAPVRVADFDVREDYRPLNMANETTLASVAPVKVENFSDILKTVADTQQPVMDTGSLAALTPNDKPAVDQNVDRLAAFHTPASATVAHFQQARESIAFHVKQAAADDVTKIRIKMTPESLGTVDVAMDIAHDGTVNAVIGADRQETYDWLRRDSQSLQDLLQQSGLKVGQDGLSFAYNDQRQAFQEKVAGLNAKKIVVDADVAKVASARYATNPHQVLDMHA